MFAAIVPFLVALGAIAGAWLLYTVLTGRWNPSWLFEGSDRRLSTSKFQWWLWIWVIAYTYITTYVARSLAVGHMADPVTDISENVFAVLGFSTLTTAVAKGVTQGYVAAGLVFKPEPDGPKAEDLVKDDSGAPDLYKLQIFLWTLIAVGIYFASLVSIVTTGAAAKDAQTALAALKFPDIDTSLMVLSGLSAAGYLGKKVVTKDAPKIVISSITPSRSTSATSLDIVLLGGKFGDAQHGSTLNIGSVVNHPVTHWSDQEIRATVPANFPKGTHPVSAIVEMRVNGNVVGKLKSNEVTLELT